MFKNSSTVGGRITIRRGFQRYCDQHCDRIAKQTKETLKCKKNPNGKWDFC
jgi:hypothetical protein